LKNRLGVLSSDRDSYAPNDCYDDYADYYVEERG
jgi:hypothetical protein